MKQVLLPMLFVATLLLSPKICASTLDIRHSNHLKLQIHLSIPLNSTLPFGAYEIRTNSSDGKPIQTHSNTHISSGFFEGYNYHSFTHVFDPGESREFFIETYKDNPQKKTEMLSLHKGVITYDDAVVDKIEPTIML